MSSRVPTSKYSVSTTAARPPTSQDQTASSSRRPGHPDRPLPPIPSSSLPNAYEIPTLRRKPESSPPTATPVKHNRSISHPFPLLFGNKKLDKKSNEKHFDDGFDSSDGEVSHKKESKHSKTAQASTTTANQNQQPMTGKCMTCDSTVRWPQGLRTFRCVTCLTINDLEPFEEQPNGGSNAAMMPPPPRRLMTISIYRTRRIIDHSLDEYLTQLLKPDAQDQVSAEPHARQQSLADRGGSQSTTYLDEQYSTLEPISTLSDAQEYVEPTSTAAYSSQNGGGRSPLRKGKAPGSDRLYQTNRRPSTNGLLDLDTDVRQKDRTVAIFRPLENYIAECFVGCTALNASFFTIRPGTEPSEKQSPDNPSRRHQSESSNTPQFEPDVFISEIDAKTLLLGDFAENGMWWTGNRSQRSEKSIEGPRERSPERWNGVVSVKTPRINWPELAQWYRMVIHAGNDWQRRWNKLKPATPGPIMEKWQSVSLDKLAHDITDSQQRLQRALLKASENLLKRPRRPLKAPEDCRFLLMVLANPLLYSFSTKPTHSHQNSRSRDRPSVPHIQSLSVSTSRSFTPEYSSSASRRSGALGHHSGIVKRILGLMSNLSNEVHQFLVSWMSRFSDGHFQSMVDLVSSFVTYRLSRQPDKKAPEPVNPTDGLVPSFSDTGVRHASQLHAALEVRPAPSSKKQAENKPRLSVYGDDWQVRAAARVMALLFQSNTGHSARKRDNTISREQRLQSAGMNAKYQANAHGQIVPISTFYNTLLDHADLIADFEAWETTKTKFTFCQYPFFLSIWAKIHILEHDARRQMEVKAREAFFDSILSRKTVSQYLVLKVRRDCLVDDSLKNVSEVVGSGSSDIKKGLRIDFAGEEGIDAGGLRKEWFLLLTREIFDPHHGLFVYDEDSQYCYFNPFCFESSEQFFLVGVLLGLAIYNSTILDVAFPPFVFKKMLASAPVITDKLTSTPKITLSYTLEDLAELHPALARGLRQLLDFEGDVQETFCRDFVAETDQYGKITEVPLCSGGEKRAVTNSNRREFVDLYVRYMLDTSVARQYEPFKRGFFTVCGGNALSLFRPEEIELLVRGSEEPLDINSLRAVATYEGWPKHLGPAEQQAQAVWFWDFFGRLKPADQRKMLGFITGSDRIPAMGATNLVIRLQLLKDKNSEESDQEVERFPIARTCFNTLSLHSYRSRETLESKLWRAVTESEGFGLK